MGTETDLIELFKQNVLLYQWAYAEAAKIALIDQTAAVFTYLTHTAMNDEIHPHLHEALTNYFAKQSNAGWREKFKEINNEMEKRRKS